MSVSQLHDDVVLVMVNPKYQDNLNSMLRVASCFGASRVMWGGTRVLDAGKHPRPKRGRDKRASNEFIDVKNTVSWSRERNPLEKLRAEGYTLVAVEVVARSESLPTFNHPTGKVAYVFGPEDGSLSDAEIKLCQRVVRIPSNGCLNVSHCGTAVLTDRTCKAALKQRRHRAA